MLSDVSATEVADTSLNMLNPKLQIIYHLMCATGKYESVTSCGIYIGKLRYQ